MSRTFFRLALALTLSLLLHILPFLGELLPQRAASTPPRPAPLRAELRSAPPPQVIPLKLDASRTDTPPPKPKTEKPPAPAKTPAPTIGWQQEVRRQFVKQQAAGQFYPAEAIAQGLQGEVEVFMILDENGQVAAARVENSSGFKLLDDAALHAVRALHALPADAPRQTILPVRFRLR